MMRFDDIVYVFVTKRNYLNVRGIHFTGSKNIKVFLINVPGNFPHKNKNEKPKRKRKKEEINEYIVCSQL